MPWTAPDGKLLKLIAKGGKAGVDISGEYLLLDAGERFKNSHLSLSLDKTEHAGIIRELLEIDDYLGGELPNYYPLLKELNTCFVLRAKPAFGVQVPALTRGDKVRITGHAKTLWEWETKQGCLPSITNLTKL